MAFKIEARAGIPIPKATRRGELSEYAKELLAVPIGHSFEFDPETEDGKKIKYYANKLQKDGLARFSYRKGKVGQPATMWRVELAPKKATTTESQPTAEEVQAE